MFDGVIGLAVQHYLITAILAVSVGVLLNLAVTVAPDIAEHFRLHKLY